MPFPPQESASHKVSWHIPIEQAGRGMNALSVPRRIPCMGRFGLLTPSWCVLRAGPDVFTALPLSSKPSSRYMRAGLSEDLLATLFSSRPAASALISSATRSSE